MPRSPEDPSVAFVGGGPAGLVAARHLADTGLDVTVFERRDAVGGRVRSTRRDGYVFDSGFQVLFTAYPSASRELDLDALDLRRFAPGATVCRPGRRETVADPFRAPTAALETLASSAVTLGDALRVLRLRGDVRKTSAAVLRDRDGESIVAFLDRRGFSESFVSEFAAPFFGGITLDRSLGGARGLFEFAFRMLATGDAAVPARGMAAIPEQLGATAREAGADLRTGTAVDAVSGDGPVDLAVGGETVTVDAVVVATDPPAARELTGLEAIPTDGRGCVTQYYALPGHVSVGADRRIMLNAEGPDPNLVVPVSAVAPEHAPADETLVSATFLGTRADADDRALAEATRESLAAWFPEKRVSDLALCYTDRINFAQFAQPPGYRSGLPDVRGAGIPVYLAGEYTITSSIDGAVESGRRAARAVLADSGVEIPLGLQDRP